MVQQSLRLNLLDASLVIMEWCIMLPLQLNILLKFLHKLSDIHFRR